MADRNLVGRPNQQQQPPPHPPQRPMRPFPPHSQYHPPSQQQQPPHLQQQQYPPPQRPPSSQPLPGQPLRQPNLPPRNLPNPSMQYPLRTSAYPPRMPMQPSPVDRNVQPYYQPNRPVPQSPLPPAGPPMGQMRYNTGRDTPYQAPRDKFSPPMSEGNAYPGMMYQQNFGQMPPYAHPATSALYGQSFPPPQTPYVPGSYATPQPPRTQQQSQVPVKRERKALLIVNPETNEVVTSSKSTVAKPAATQEVKADSPAVSSENLDVKLDSSHLESYRIGQSKALKIEDPSKPSASLQKPASKALKIEAPPTSEGEKSAPAPTMSIEKGAQSKMAHIDARTNGTYTPPVHHSKPDIVKVAESTEKQDVVSQAPAAIPEDLKSTSTISSAGTAITEKRPQSTRQAAIQQDDSVREKVPADVSVPTAVQKSVSFSKPQESVESKPSTESSAKEVSSLEPTSVTALDKKVEPAQLTSTPVTPTSRPPVQAAKSEPMTPAAAVSTPVPALKQKDTDGKDVDPVVEALTPETSSANVTAVDAGSVQSKDDGMSWRSATSPAVQDPLEKSWRENSEGVPSKEDTKMENGTPGTPRTPMKRPRPRAIVHEDGARRVYPLDWIMEMKDFCLDTKPPIEAQQSQIAKGMPKKATGSQRGSQGGRGGTGGAQWARGQQMSNLFGGVGVKGAGQYASGDRIPRRGGKRPPVPTPQMQNWRDASRRHELPPLARGPPQAPVKPLEKTENAWKRKREDDDEVSAKRKTVRSILNKLTPEKFERLYKQMVAVEITNVDVLDGVVREIFEKAVLEPKFADMYSELCSRLSKETAKMLADADLVSENGKPITFKRMLVTNVVQAEFQKFASETKEDKEENEEGKKESSAEEKEGDEINAAKAKRRMLGNINFIGELYKKSLIPEKKIHENCVQKLLNRGINTLEEDVLEALCKLLASVGQKLSENAKAKRFMDAYFTEIEKLSRDHKLPSRIRFMLQNLIEMRQNNWKKRREEAKAKKISEVHADIQREERQKQEASTRNRGRSSSGRFSSRFDRPSSRIPAPTMTMAPARSRNGPTMSRAVMSREKLAEQLGGHGRVQSVSGDVRLSMPSSRRVLTGTGGPIGGMSLKPGGSRFSSNAFSALAEVDESSPSSAAVKMKSQEMKTPSSKIPRRIMSEPVLQKPALDAQKVKYKAKNNLDEFLAIQDLKEARECVETEIPEASHAQFIEEALRHAIDMNPQKSEKLIPVFVEWTKIIDAEHYQDKLSMLVSTLDDIEMDSPNASIFLSKILAKLSALKKLIKRDDDPSMVLKFIGSKITDIMDGKRAIKLLLRTYSELEKELAEIIPDEKERQEALYNAFTPLDVNLKNLAVQWNPGRGLSVLKDMLAEYKVEYLAPLIGVDDKIRELFSGGKDGKEISQVIKASVPENTVGSRPLAQLLAREGLQYACEETKAATKESLTKEQIEEETTRLKSSVTSAIVELYGKVETETFLDERFAILLEVQKFSNEFKFPPGIPDSQNKESKLIARLFTIMYDDDVVDEDLLKKWKDDIAESNKIGGKREALVQTQRFFQWLETAETEE